MSVSNKTIREFEAAAVEAQLAMNGVAELLEAAGMAKLAQLLRLRAVALDLAESACARERCLGMSDVELREEFEALGWECTNDVDAFDRMQRLLSRHDDPEPQPRRCLFCDAELPVTQLGPQCGECRLETVEIVARDVAAVGLQPETLEAIQAAVRGQYEEFEARGYIQPGGIADLIRSQYEQVFGSEAAAGTEITGVMYPTDEQVAEPVEKPRRIVAFGADGSTFASPGWDTMTDPAGDIGELAKEIIRLGDEEPTPNVVLLEDSPEAREAAARIHGLNQEHGFTHLPEPALVRLDDGDITRLLAEQIAEEFGISRAELDPFTRGSLLRLHKTLCAYAKPDSTSGQMNEDQAIALAGFMASTLRLSPSELAEHGARRKVGMVADLQLLDLPIGHQPGGLGDGGKSEMEAWTEYVDDLKARLHKGLSIPDIDRLRREYPALSETQPAAGAPIQVALGSAAPAPGETFSMVTIIGHTKTAAGAVWVSDHGLMWARGIGDGIINAPCLSDHPPDPAEVIRGRWDLTPEVDAELAKHFDGVPPLTAEEIYKAGELQRLARERSL